MKHGLLIGGVVITALCAFVTWIYIQVRKLEEQLNNNNEDHEYFIT